MAPMPGAGNRDLTRVSSRDAGTEEEGSEVSPMDARRQRAGPDLGLRRDRAEETDRSPETLTEVEVLRGVSRAFGSSSDVEEATASAVRWVQASVGQADAKVRIFLIGSDGGLETVVPRIEAADGPERWSERRHILEGRRPARSPVAGGQTLVTIPLLTRGEPVGVLEVVAPQTAVEERWTTMQAVASHVAIVLRNLRHRAELTANLDGLLEISALSGEMVRARTPEDALRTAVRFCNRRFRVPAGGWLRRGDLTRLDLVSSWGLGTAGGRRLRSQMATLRNADLANGGEIHSTAERFAELAGVDRADAVVARDAVILVGRPSAGAPFRLLEEVLDDVLDHLVVVADAERRNQRLDIGIALTAHEVRGPLVGAMAIIERLLMGRGDAEEADMLLLRSRHQLEQLARLVDGLLWWAVAGRPLELRPADLGSLVREAVQACSIDPGTDRVILKTSGAVPILADPDHLRGAIANVLRNALIYAPPETKVSVAVGVEDGMARVIVRDRGPGIPASERELIFDPLKRGAAASLTRAGNGLGLFIARRVMEAHRGAIWLSSGRIGATFTMQIPLRGTTHP
jgi:signal transduction histidine kinase